MNHAFVLPVGMTLGGVTTWSVNLTRKLAAAGEHATLIEHSAPGIVEELRRPALPEVRIVECPGRPAWSVTVDDVLGYLSSYSSTLPATIIPNWSSDTYATCALLSLTRASDMRVIGFAHSDETAYYDWLTYYEPIIHVLVAASDDIAVKLRSLLPHREGDVLMCPYAVEAPARLSRGAPLPGTSLQLMYAGRLQERQKRISDLVALVRELMKNQVDFRLRVIGEGSEKLWLSQEVQLLGPQARECVMIEDTVHFDQMADRWRSADVCVLVSEYEGLSISMLEAMAQGCVPVVTRVSGTTAVIRDGVNGLTVPVGDIAQMARLIKGLASDRVRLHEMGRRAHETILEGFVFEKYIPWFLAASKQAWRKGPREWRVDRPLLLRKVDVVSDRSLVRRSVGKLRDVVMSIHRSVRLSRGKRTRLTK